MKFIASFCLSISLIMLTLPAQAQDIRWKTELMTPGDYVTIDQTQFGRVHHVFRGKSGQYFITDTYFGPRPEGSPAFTTRFDKNGNYVRWESRGGEVIRYIPHDCKRTAGQCVYTQIRGDGTRLTRTRITTPTRNGFKFQEYDHTGAFLFGGQMKLDERGMAGNGKIKGPNGSNTFRLVKTYYQ